MNRCDFHTHTTYSDGCSSVIDMVRAAEGNGLCVLGITDHLFDLRSARRVKRMVTEAQKIQSHVRILPGAEAAILDTRGTIAVNTQIARELKLVLADLGCMTDGIGKNAQASKRRVVRNVIETYVQVCANPFVHIIAHPFNLGRFATPVFLRDFSRMDLRVVARAFVAGGKIFEIMNHAYWWFPQVGVKRFTHDYLNVITLFADEGVQFSLGSDAHNQGAVGNLFWANAVVAQAGIARSLIAPNHFY